jgi:HEAT repeat protein
MVIISVTLALHLMWTGTGFGQDVRKRPRAKTSARKPKSAVTPAPQPETPSPQPVPPTPPAATPSEPAEPKPEKVEPPPPAPPKLQKDEVRLQELGGGVTVSAALSRGHFKSGSEQYNFRTFRNEFVGVECPTWIVNVSIKNPTDQTLELGESLMVVESLKDSQLYLPSYLLRERAEPADHLHRIGERYQLLWGYKVSTGGTALIPFMALMGVLGGGAADALTLLLATFSSPQVEVYEGLGYGRVSPHAERTLRVELVTPVGIRQEKREIFVVLPSFHHQGRAANAKAYTICRFDAGAQYSLLETISVKTNVAELSAIINDESLPSWRRIFALNWMAEEHRPEAESALLQIATNPNQAIGLRNAAITNLGAWQIKSAAAPLLGILDKADNNAIRKNAIEALGYIGDQAAAANVRSYLNHAEDDVAATAIEAAGKLKDGEAVAQLQSMLLDDKKSKRHPACISALQAIANEAAVAALGQALASEKPAENVRQQLVSALGVIGGAPAVSILSGTAESRSESARAAALTVLAGMKSAGAADAVIAFAARKDYSSRSKAISLLGENKVASGLPVLRQVAADSSAKSEARQAACGALAKLSDNQAKESLLAAATDADASLYESALDALAAIYDKDADATLITAIQSRHSSVRRMAVRRLRNSKSTELLTAIANAYQNERDANAGEEMTATLIALGFSDKAFVPILIGRLDPKKNPLWFEDVRLLRHLTGEKLGPEYKWTGNDKDRAAELEKWRQWWAGKKEQ